MIPKAKRMNRYGGFCTEEGFEIKSNFGEAALACAERISRGLRPAMRAEDFDKN